MAKDEDGEFRIPLGRGLESLIQDTRTQDLPDSVGRKTKTRVHNVGRVYIDEKLKPFFDGKTVNIFLRVEDKARGHALLSPDLPQLEIELADKPRQYEFHKFSDLADRITKAALTKSREAHTKITLRNTKKNRTLYHRGRAVVRLHETRDGVVVTFAPTEVEVFTEADVRADAQLFHELDRSNPGLRMTVKKLDQKLKDLFGRLMDIISN